MIVNEYIFGSKLYGTSDQYSDTDVIYVVDDDINNYKELEHVFSIQEFQTKLDNMDIAVLECFFSPDKFKSVKHNFTFNYNEDLLRKSISTISSNSWVKGKKKLIVYNDYDLRAGLKSVFHSIRILDFGIQIATNKKITRFDTYNYVLKDLFKLSNDYHYEELWNMIETKYKRLYNELKSQFKRVCKHKSDNEIKDFLNKTLKKYNVSNDDINKIYNYFK